MIAGVSRGFPGLLRLPVFKQFLSNNDQQITQTDIVMLLTPHIVRTHELTADDLSPIYIGTQQNLGLGGPPPLIAPAPDEPVPSVGQGPTQVIPTTPGVSPGGVPRSAGGIRPGCAAGQPPDAARHVGGADADCPSAGEACRAASGATASGRGAAAAGRRSAAGRGSADGRCASGNGPGRTRHWGDPARSAA